MSEEQPFKQALRKRIFLQLRIELWPQPPGKLQLKRGGWIECAPVGAADLTGLVTPEGWRLEIECKGKNTPETEAQRAWRAWIIARGGIALQARWNEGETFQQALTRCVSEVEEAIRLRRLQPTRRAVHL
jgi:hypothetical protein